LSLELNRIYCGDCLDLMKEIPDKSIDLVLTDPPYSNQTHTGMRSTKNGDDPSSTIDFNSVNSEEIIKIFSSISPKSKRWIISFMDWRFMHLFEQTPPKDTRFIRFGVWYKKTTCPQFTGDRPGTGWEAILFLHKQGGKMYWNGGGCGSSVYSFNNARGDSFFLPSNHPTEKPVKLLVKLITQFTDPGDTVLDPFLGSGTTAIACKRTGRNFIGIEKEPKYVEIALKRLEKVNNRKLSEFLPIDEVPA
jgi:site-specific DNA-methyltransferase (adenine-specific)